MYRLDYLRDWIKLGREAHYDRAELAKLCQISQSQLSRFFLARLYRPPQEWLNELRTWDAMEILMRGESVKETAYQLSFADASHFSHCFKRTHGFAPAMCLGIVGELMRRHPFFAVVPPWERARRALLSPLRRPLNVSDARHRHVSRVTDMKCASGT